MLADPWLAFASMVMVVISYGAIGRLFGFKKIFTSMVVGLALVALILASLANFEAFLIRPTALAMLLVGLILIIRSLILGNGKKIVLGREYWFILAILLAIFLINIPSHIFIKDGTLLFNPHYSYYSGQSIEMLTANYLGRLRILEIWPLEWCRYHFFNSSAQSAVSALVIHPNLFSYFFAQLLIALIIIGSIIENIFDTFSFNLKNAIKVVIWLLFGFTLFGHALIWNFATTGAFTVFAIFMILLSVYKKDVKDFIIYSLIFGASAYRLMPLWIVLFVLLILYVCKEHKNLHLRERLSRLMRTLIPNVYYLIFYIIFIIYNFLTLIAAKSPTALAIKTIYASNLSYEGWDYVLSFYKIAGVVNKGLFHFRSIFLYFNLDGYMQKAIDHRLAIYLLVALISWGALALARAGFAGIKANRSGSIILLGAPTLAILLAIFLYLPLDLKELVFIVVPYLLFAFYLLYQMRQQESYFYLKVTLWWMLSFTLLLQFTGLPLSIKAPVLCSIYDLSLWSLLGIYLISTEIKSKIIYSLVVIIVALSICLPFYAYRMSEIVTPQNHVSISELIGPKVNRELYLISGTNSCNFNFDDGYKNIVFAAVLGCNLGNQSNHKGSMSEQFIKP